MVNVTFAFRMKASNLTADQQLCLAYAGGRQTLFRALFDLEAAVSQIALTAHEPLLAQIKLAWWAEDGLGNPKGGSAIGDAVLGLSKVADHQAIVPLFIEAWKAAAYGPDGFGDAATLRAEAWSVALGIGEGRLLDALKSWAELDLFTMTGGNGDGFQKAQLRVLRHYAKPLAVLALLASQDGKTVQERRSKPGSPKRIARAFFFVATGRIL